MANKKGKYTLEEYCKLNNMEYLLSEWDYEKNVDRGPASVSSGNSKIKVWWKCNKGHSFVTDVYNRVSKRSGCPYCTGRVLTGYNDLITINPEYICEWDYEKNIGINPRKEGLYSKKKVGWICRECSNRWEAIISSRSEGRGCPVCAIKRRSARSRVKKGINDFQTWCNNNGRKDLLDEWDEIANGISTSDVAFGSHKVYKWICHICNSQFESNIPNRRFGNNCPYCSNQKVKEGTNDFFTFCVAEGRQDLLDEWDYKSNEIKPNQITKGSSKKVFWICKECGNSYDSTISHRFAGRSCPFCKDDGRKRVWPGVNDFKTFCEQNEAEYLLEEWDYEKNDCAPSQITYGSTKMIWWKCLRCHTSFKLLPSKRRRGDGCPNCSKYVRTSFREQALFYYISNKYPSAISGYKEKDLELDIFIPEKRIAIEYDGQEWHQNIERDIRKIDECIKRDIMLINVREPNCPFLDIKNKCNIYQMQDISEEEFERVLLMVLEKLDVYNLNVNLDKDRFNIYKLYLGTSYKKSVAFLHPELVDEWDYDSNNGIGPEYFAAGSAKLVSWICKTCGSSYKKAINQRIKGSACPVCSNRKIVVGINDLNTTRPELAKEWNYEKNVGLAPTDVTYGCDKSVWWICEKKHEWQAPVYNRSNGVGCPYCSNKRVLAGYNDLETAYPNIAKQWNYRKNGNLIPSNISPGSARKVWWIGEKCNHTFYQPVNLRVKGIGCSVCASRQGRVITNIDTGEVFYSLTEAAKSCGKSNQSRLLEHLHGKRDSAYGFHWKEEVDKDYIYEN